MGRLQNLKDLLKTKADNVYFSPPPNLTMEYPAIRFERMRSETKRADNLPYSDTQGWALLVIDLEADSVLLDEIKSLPMCQHDRHYVANNLHHDAFTLFF